MGVDLNSLIILLLLFLCQRLMPREEQKQKEGTRFDDDPCRSEGSYVMTVAQYTISPDMMKMMRQCPFVVLRLLFLYTHFRLIDNNITINGKVKGISLRHREQFQMGLNAPQGTYQADIGTEEETQLEPFIICWWS